MEIISHRGYWKEASEKNKKEAFERSFHLFFGTETDIRDYNGELVISHDIGSQYSMSLVDFLEIYKGFKEEPLLALNIKADGLQNKLQYYLEQYSVKNYFCFDMSVPDTLGYINKGLNTYIRMSEFESKSALYKNSNGIWLDCFNDVWYSENLVKECLSDGKKVAIVSSDIHKREYKEHWSFLNNWEIISNDEIILCTDFPEEAKDFFDNE